MIVPLGYVDPAGALLLLASWSCPMKVIQIVPQEGLSLYASNRQISAAQGANPCAVASKRFTGELLIGRMTKDWLADESERVGMRL